MLCVSQEVESFLHRSGRTGRAGRTGTAIAMFTPRESRYMKRVLKETSITNCEMIGPPNPAEVMSNAAKAVCTLRPLKSPSCLPDSAVCMQ